MCLVLFFLKELNYETDLLFIWKKGIKLKYWNCKSFPANEFLFFVLKHFSHFNCIGVVNGIQLLL